MTEKPRMKTGEAQKAVDAVDAQVSGMQAQMSAMTPDKINETAPEAEFRPDQYLTKKALEQFDAPFIKPTKSFLMKGKPRDQEKEARKRGWEYVKCVASNNEVTGELIEFWHNKFAGDPVYFWQIPTNIPIWIPRHVAEHIATRKYHRLKMQDRPLGQLHAEMGSSGTFSNPSGSFLATETIKRLDCTPVGFGFGS